MNHKNKKIKSYPIGSRTNCLRYTSKILLVRINDRIEYNINITAY